MNEKNHELLGQRDLDSRHKSGIHKLWEGFPGGAVVESPPVNAGDMGSSPGLGRSHIPWSK